MHQRRVMHRDLKVNCLELALLDDCIITTWCVLRVPSQPANIFLTLNGTVKVGDLGLGRLFSENTFEAFSKVCHLRDCLVVWLFGCLIVWLSGFFRWERLST